MSENIPRIDHRREIHDNRFFTVVEEKISRPGVDGYSYYQLETKFNAVVVVPELDDGQLVVEKIYRHPYRQWIYEFPAGGIEPGEDPLVAGARELLEETGYEAAEMEHLGSYEAMPGLMRMRVYVVRARGLVQTDQRALEVMELIHVESMSVERCRELTKMDITSSFLLHGLLLHMQEL